MREAHRRHLRCPIGQPFPDKGCGNGDDIAALLPIRGSGWPRAVSAAVHDCGLQLAQEVERFGRPPRHEVEPLPIPAALQFEVDRTRFLVERQAAGVARIRRQELDHVLLRRRSALRWLLHDLLQRRP